MSSHRTTRKNRIERLYRVQENQSLIYFLFQNPFHRFKCPIYEFAFKLALKVIYVTVLAEFYTRDIVPNSFPQWSSKVWKEIARLWLWTVTQRVEQAWERVSIARVITGLLTLIVSGGGGRIFAGFFIIQNRNTFDRSYHFLKPF